MLIKVLILLTAFQNLSGCKQVASEEKSENSSAKEIEEESDGKYVVVETKPVPPETALDCSSWDLPMSKRFPNHILLNGVNSEQVYLKTPWLAWYFVPVLPGALKDKKSSCIVEGAGGASAELQCSFQSSINGKRTLRIPLIASHQVYSWRGKLQKDSGQWLILNAKLEGKRVYGRASELTLACEPRDPAFGYQPMSSAEIKKVQPWDK